MKLAIIGYGKMGRAIEQAALARGFAVVAIIDPARPGPSSITRETLAGADVCVEFTAPAAAVGNIRAAAAAGVPIVVGTTGWYDRLKEVQDIIVRASTGLVYAPNFSPGIGMMSQMLRKAAEIVNRLENYEISMTETHHTAKLDRPSGTALALARILTDGVSRKKSVAVVETRTAAVPSALAIRSIRTGDVVGEHTITFESANDTIELKHAVKNRNGFVQGALAAAQWIIGKKGVYTMEDVV